MYGGGRSTTPTGKRYESLSSDEYFSQQSGGGGGASSSAYSSSSSQQQPQRTFQAYGQSSGTSSYQQGASPAISDALSSGWSKLSSLAKAVAQSTQKAVHDSGIYDAVQGLMGSNSTAPQKSSLLGEQGDPSSPAVTPRQQYSSSYQSYDGQGSSTASRTPTTSPSLAPLSKPRSQFVGPTAASQGLKPATGADDEFNELVHGGMSKSRGAKASQPGDGPLLEDMPDVDAWLDSTLAMEAAKQASATASTDSSSSLSQRPAEAETKTKTDEPTSASAEKPKDGESELGDDWDTW